MKTYFVEYVSEVNKDNLAPCKKEILVKGVNIVQALDKISKRVHLYRRILSISEMVS
jgi:hypothetical protein